MAYIDDEKSVHDATPHELFKFDGTYTSYYYTSGPRAIDYGGNTYEPISIKRTEVATGTQDDDGLDITVEMPVTTPVAQDYGFQISPPKLTLTIYRYNKIADVVPYWKGPVDNVQVQGGLATIRSPSVLSFALSAAAPDVYFQAPCNHALYDARCKVVHSLWSVDTTLTSFDGYTLTLASVGTLDGKLVGGEAVLPSGERRMITHQAGIVLTVNYPFSVLTDGMAVEIAAGCDHAFNGDCKLKFANQLNYGGFPFIPPENVFQDGIEPGTAIPDNTCVPAFAPYWFKLKFDFWADPSGDGPSGSEYGPPSFPGFFGLGVDIADTHTGYPHQIYGDPIVQHIVGPHAVQGMIVTIPATIDIASGRPDPTTSPHDYNFELQFPFASMPDGGVRHMAIWVKRHTDDNYEYLGNDFPEVRLYPTDYYVHF